MFIFDEKTIACLNRALVFCLLYHVTVDGAVLRNVPYYIQIITSLSSNIIEHNKQKELPH